MTVSLYENSAFFTKTLLFVPSRIRGMRMRTLALTYTLTGMGEKEGDEMD